MRRLGTTFLLVFILWVALTYSFHPENLIAGVIISLTITFISRHLLSRETPRVIMHPMKWFASIVYIGYMVYAEALAHLDVIIRVFTGRIRPAIVEVPVKFETSLGKTLLGNSITLTPGTLTVNAEKRHRFFVHTLRYRKDQDIGGMFHKLGKKVIR